MSSVTKLKLDQYCVMTNSYTEFQINTSKDDREKSGKLKYDGRTDRQTASKLLFPHKKQVGYLLKTKRGLGLKSVLPSKKENWYQILQLWTLLVVTCASISSHNIRWKTFSAIVT